MESYDFVRAARPDMRHEAVLEPVGRGAGRAALVASTILRRAVTATVGAPCATESLRAENRRWFAFAQSSVRFGVLPGDLAGIAETFLGAPARRLERGVTPLEASVLMPRLTEVLRPLAIEVGGVLVPDATLHETVAPDTDEPGVAVPVVLEIDGAGFELLVTATPTGRQLAPVSDRDAMVAIVDTVPLELVVGFPNVAIPSEELRSVDIGDVIRLDQATDALLSGTVGGQCILRGRAGQNRRRLTLEVIEVELGGVA
jgi:flagellar motor switch/type III secretory pathway protein FliN